MLAAEMIIQKISVRPCLNLLVPTGDTPKGVYRILQEQNPKLFDCTTFFNMDEYCRFVSGTLELVAEKDPVSYRYYMEKHLFRVLSFQASHFPSRENITHEGIYDGIIRKAGGIDLCLNAFGEDGHTFGFNFPGTSFGSRTRIIEVSEETKNVNSGLTGMETPPYAITTGLLTGMESREVIILVSGHRKARILAKILQSPKPSIEVPASIMKTHHSCLWIVDEAAASMF